MNLSVPSKTFLLGEYSVLFGHPAILINTLPQFCLLDVIPESAVAKQRRISGIQAKNIPPESPAGKLYRDYLSFFSKKEYYFVDPYAGRGGFGASTAQFILLANLLGLKDPWQVWEKYREYTKQTDSISPSGADIISQMVGGIVFFHANNKIIESLVWPFPDVEIALIHTGKKLATHEYLKDVSPRTCCGVQYSEIVFSSYEAIKNKQLDSFVKAINKYAGALKEIHCVAQHTEVLLKKVQDELTVLAAKGCGAMGADVILVCIEQREKQALVEWVKKQQLDLVFCGNHFSQGISV